MKAWSLFNVGTDVRLCDITFRCNDAACCYCASNLNFTCGVNCWDCAIVSGNEAGPLPVAWVDGTFTCGTQEPDLIVESVSINPDCKHYYFANEPNVLNVTVRNIGNVEIDVNITGSDMESGGDTITKDRMDAQVDTLGYLDLSVARCFDANMTAGVSSLENVDFRLNVPYGTPVGSYNGSVTLTADTCG